VRVAAGVALRSGHVHPGAHADTHTTSRRIHAVGTTPVNRRHKEPDAHEHAAGQRHPERNVRTQRAARGECDSSARDSHVRLLAGQQRGRNRPAPISYTTDDARKIRPC
jgi:hypothetical protein